MAQVSKAIVDKQLRETVFDMVFTNEIESFHKVNDRQMGVILTDLNGVQRYVRLGAIVAEIREDMTAQELMDSEIEAYNAKQEAKAEKAKAKEAKIAKDKARREAKAAEKGE